MITKCKYCEKQRKIWLIGYCHKCFTNKIKSKNNWFCRCCGIFMTGFEEDCVRCGRNQLHDFYKSIGKERMRKPKVHLI